MVSWYRNRDIVTLGRNEGETRFEGILGKGSGGNRQESLECEAVDHGD